MATITEKNGSFHVQIRKKNIKINATFHNEQDAKLWVSWKEDLANQIDTFQPPIDELITIEQAIDLKADQFDKKSRNYSDFIFLKSSFKEIIDMPISYLNYENMQIEWDKMIRSEVSIGGNRKSNSGRKKIISPITCLKKFILLNAVINNLIENKLTIVNNLQPFITHIRKSLNE